MALKLITEMVKDVRSLVTEAKDGLPKSYYIEGIFMQGARKNQNGRVYPTSTLRKEVDRYTTENIARKRAFGELGHPESPTVNLDRVSHMITELTQDRDDFVGRAKVMVHTPMGAIVKALIDEGAELGVSSRGLGSLKETSSGMEVQDDFYFSAMDIVADPSAPDAFVRGIMEGKQWVWESGALKEQELDQMVRTIEEAHIPTIPVSVKQETLVKTFEDFMLALRSGVRSKINLS
jgi:hypothetical protein